MRDLQLATLVALLGSASSVVAQSPFATRVIEYVPAPGQNVQNGQFNDPSRALGAPVGGGTAAADNSKVVTLGGFGGTITLGFDHAIINQPASERNPRGLDLIVFGNAFWVGNNPQRRFAEPGVIELSRDENGNGLADDAWYVIPGSHLPSPPNEVLFTQTYDTDIADLTNPPRLASWIPIGRSGTWTVTTFMLPASLNGPVLVNPLGPDSTAEGIFGYADCSPTMVLGDLDGDGIVDDPGLTPEQFFTVPHDPFLVGNISGSGGGDAIDISAAVDPVTGETANLPSIDFVRITTAVNFVHPVFGEVSTEVGGVAEVRLPLLTDFNGDGVVNADDLADFITAYFDGSLAADFNADGVLNSDDLSDFITAFFL